MPVRSLRSSILKWPAKEQVEKAFRSAATVLLQNERVVGLAWYGSYARGDWGVGSDVDVLVVMESNDTLSNGIGLTESGRGDRRSDLSRTQDAFARLPVPVDVVLLTSTEWNAHRGRLSRFYRTIRAEALILRDPDEPDEPDDPDAAGSP